MKIANMKGRSKGSGYNRLFNDASFGELLSKAQAAVISNGSELERLILARTQNIDNLDTFISEIEMSLHNVDGVYVCTKTTLRKSQYSIPKIEPDLLIFIIEKKRICKIIELKDGDTFDTKKAEAERQHLQEFSKEFGSRVPFATEYFICCFNQPDKNYIYHGFKLKFDISHIMTGEELCDLLRINYNEIVHIREIDAAANREYFIKQLLTIKSSRNLIINELIKEGIIK